jgi:hypothetical protein
MPRIVERCYGRFTASRPTTLEISDLTERLHAMRKHAKRAVAGGKLTESKYAHTMLSENDIEVLLIALEECPVVY